MIAETVFVGTELLLGQIVNTNAAYLGERLSLLGIDCYYQSVVGDNPKRLMGCLRQSMTRSDVVITSGGLGPTMDDLTRETVAELTNRPLHFDPEIWQRIVGTRRGAVPANMKRQAMVPLGATVLPNDVGTAPGLAVPVADSEHLFVLLPGPPHELQAMFENYVIPLLLSRMGERTTLVSRSLHFCGIGESPLEERLQDLFANQTDPTLATYATPGDVQLRISTKAGSKEEGLQRILSLEEMIRNRVGEYLYGVDGVTLEEAVGALLTQLGWRVGVVDTQGGGTLAARLTAPSGSQNWFAWGLIAHSCEQAVEYLRRAGAHPVLTRRSENDSLRLASMALSLGPDAVATLVKGEEGNVHVTVMAKTQRQHTVSLTSRGDLRTQRRRVSQSALAALRRLILEHLNA